MTDYQDKVEARVAEEAADLPTKPTEEVKLPLPFLLQCLYANRVGDANLYAALHRGKFVYVNLWGRWLKWAGNNWAEDIDNAKSLAAVERVCEEYQRIFVEHDEGKNSDSELAKAVKKRLNVLRDRAGRENLLDLARSIDEPLSVMATDLDRQEYLLACPNTVVDLRTGEARPGDPNQYILNACPTPWQGLETSSPAFMEFLNSSFDDDTEMVSFVLRLLGYGLLGNRDDHIWSIFHGPRGRNGKDTLMKVLFRVIGSTLAIKVPTAMLLQQTFQRSGSQPEPDIIALRGAKMAFANEGEAGQKIAMSRLKDLTGGSIITARGINDKHMTSWDQTHLLFFLTNELPTMRADDDAFWTRVLAIHWPVRFVDNPQAPDERQRDPRMARRLELEASGVLTALVIGAMDYLENGLNPPDKVLNYTKEQRENFDSIGQFLTECCLREDQPPTGMDWSTRIPVNELVAICNWWCKKSLGNAYPYSPKRITQSLSKKSIKTHKSSSMYYLGVLVKDEVMEDYRKENRDANIDSLY